MESVSLATEDINVPGRTISVAPRPAAARLGVYEIIAKLGQGTLGVVWKARHLRQGHTVALKTLPLDQLERRPDVEESREVQREEGERLHFFKQEFRTLADLRCWLLDKREVKRRWRWPRINMRLRIAMWMRW